jgi:hypothetical protein
MDNGYNENFAKVWSGEGMPDVRNYTTTGELVQGRPYRFYVEAINTVGTGSPSAYTTIYACDDVGIVSAP